MFIGSTISGISAHRVRVQSHTLSNSEDINLATWLATQSPDVTKIQVVTIPVGHTVGGTVTDGYALTTGNLSTYTKGVELIVEGRIEGKGGAANGGNGSHGLEVTSDLHLVDASNIYGGGGGGGQGGLGAYGTQTTGQNGPFYQQTNIYVYRFGAGQISYWNGTNIGIAGSGFIYYSPHWYRSAAFVEANMYYISQYTWATGTKGTGGAGGVGEGYNQSKSNGSTGNSGTYNAGDGGTGGNGGTWGTAGNAGGTGGNGSYITTSDWSQTSYGDSGGSGGLAGNATVENGGSIIATHLY